jgi:hypothetical protein
MNSATLELPTGEALEREIENIEARTRDERIRQTIIERVAIANDPKTAFISHEEVFAASSARLMARLTSKGNA